jgi:drug/metabolite transporter (DMT)-like permease
MKNKIGIISGFVIGSIGFLLLFKVTILNHTPPEDELAPGIVVLAAVLIGVASSFIGYFLQNYLSGEGNY